MSNIKKFTDQELDSIKKLQQSYQDKLIMFGQINIEKIAIEKAIEDLKETENKVRLEYIELQKEEEKLIESLSTKYGEGSLNLKDGTFTPLNK